MFRFDFLLSSKGKYITNNNNNNNKSCEQYLQNRPSWAGGFSEANSNLKTTNKTKGNKHENR